MKQIERVVKKAVKKATGADKDKSKDTSKSKSKDRKGKNGSKRRSADEFQDVKDRLGKHPTPEVFFPEDFAIYRHRNQDSTLIYEYWAPVCNEEGKTVTTKRLKTRYPIDVEGYQVANQTAVLDMERRDKSFANANEKLGRTEYKLLTLKQLKEIGFGKEPIHMIPEPVAEHGKKLGLYDTPGILLPLSTQKRRTETRAKARGLRGLRSLPDYQYMSPFHDDNIITVDFPIDEVTCIPLERPAQDERASLLGEIRYTNEKFEKNYHLPTLEEMIQAGFPKKGSGDVDLDDPLVLPKRPVA